MRITFFFSQENLDVIFLFFSFFQDNLDSSHYRAVIKRELTLEGENMPGKNAVRVVVQIMYLFDFCGSLSVLFMYQ